MMTALWEYRNVTQTTQALLPRHVGARQQPRWHRHNRCACVSRFCKNGTLLTKSSAIQLRCTFACESRIFEPFAFCRFLPAPPSQAALRILIFAEFTRAMSPSILCKMLQLFLAGTDPVFLGISSTTITAIAFLVWMNPALPVSSCSLLSGAFHALHPSFNACCLYSPQT